jgi:hypothetical protein
VFRRLIVAILSRLKALTHRAAPTKRRALEDSQQCAFGGAHSSAVEHLTFNQRVVGSNPAGLTKSNSQGFNNNPRQHFRTFLQQSVVKVITGVVQAFALTIANAEIATRHFLQHESEVL